MVDSPDSSDLRRLAVRPGLADARLRGKVQADRFVEGHLHHAVQPVTAVRRHPGDIAPRDTEVLYGERVRVFDQAAGWAWAQLETDGYVGYVPASALEPCAAGPTHHVTAVRAIVYSGPSALSEPRMTLSLGSALAVAGETDGFSELPDGGFIGTRHLSQATRNAPDFVTVAERFLGTPYVFGGRSCHGIDCSGLVQAALSAAGIRAPRDSDMQQVELGESIESGDQLDGLRRGDLCFWPGHVGIMTAPDRIVHANATHMQVTHEPISDVADRSRKDGPRILAVRRL
ncbi:MAG TPA: NlpC/P60 family protein [Hyphomicrobiaceae bacterium]|nr:NlpC/P60 family protein [Hyphomicrobiaceae bacterium]